MDFDERNDFQSACGLHRWQPEVRLVSLKGNLSSQGAKGKWTDLCCEVIAGLIDFSRSQKKENDVGTKKEKS